MAQNKLPSKKGAKCKLENIVEKLLLLGHLLFKITTTSEKETVLLAVPEIYADKIITLYHTSLFTGHQGVIKTYLTISDKFFIPGLMVLLKIIHKRMPYLSIGKGRQATNKTATTQNLSKL